MSRTSAAPVQVSFQQIQLRLYSKCSPLAFTHARGGYIYNRLMWRFFRITKNYWN